MSGSEQGLARSVRLAQESRDARSRAADARSRAIVAAKAAAAAQERAAASCDQLAGLLPREAARLRDMSASARERAAREWQWAEDHAACRIQVNLSVQAPARSPDDAAVGPGDRDAAISAERDRVAAEVQDMVIRRIFAAGLNLESAAGLASEPEVRRRVEAAIEELDQVIRHVRDAVFSAWSRPYGGLCQDILDLCGQLAPAASISYTGAPGRSEDLAADRSLCQRLSQALTLIREYAIPIHIHITAGSGSYRLVVESLPLSPMEAAGGPPRWFTSLRARAGQNGMWAAAGSAGRIMISSHAAERRAL